MTSDFVLFCVITIILGVCLYCMPPNESTIQSCVDVTGWSEARCVQELSR